MPDGQKEIIGTGSGWCLKNNLICSHHDRSDSRAGVRNAWRRMRFTDYAIAVTQMIQVCVVIIMMMM